MGLALILGPSVPWQRVALSVLFLHTIPLPSPCWPLPHLSPFSPSCLQHSPGRGVQLPIPEKPWEGGLLPVWSPLSRKCSALISLTHSSGSGGAPVSLGLSLIPRERSDQLLSSAMEPGLPLISPSPSRLPQLVISKVPAGPHLCTCWAPLGTP